MKIEGQHTFDAPREEVWEAVLDPDVLTKVLPGCEEFKQVGENKFQGILKIKVGPVQGKFKGDVELSDLVAPSSYKLHLKGKGAPGFVDGKGELKLEDDGGKTRIVYDIDTKVGGRIATVGQRLLDSSTKVISRQALEGLERQLAVRGQLQDAEAEAAAAEAAAAEAKAKARAAPRKPARAAKAAQTPAQKPAKKPTAATAAADARAAAERAEAAASRAEAAASSAEAQLARARAEAARAQAESLGPPSQARFATDFARGLFEEMVPEEQRKSVLGVAGIALLALVLLLFKGC